MGLATLHGIDLLLPMMAHGRFCPCPSPSLHRSCIALPRVGHVSCCCRSADLGIER
jgi:hypothetical protein